MRNLISVVCVLVLFTLQTFAQQDSCNDPKCRTGSLIVNTGYDHTTNARFPTGQQDPYWILTAAPTNSGTVNLNGPANVIPTVWGSNSTIDNQSRYISAFNTAGANAANITGVPYRFERCFCVCDDSSLSVNVNYNLTARADNRVQFFFDGIPLPGQPGQLSTTTGLNFDNTDDANNMVIGSMPLSPGRHCLWAELRNDDQASNMGLNISGTLSTSTNSLLQENCCNNQGFIVGYKFQDDNCDGKKNVNESYLQGWQIQLNGNGISQTTTTDAQGYYTFSVPAGTYTVSEVLQSGWTPSTPAGGSQSGVVVTAGSVIRVDFGNCPFEEREWCCPGDNLVLNGDFESGNTGFTSAYNYQPVVALSSILPGDYGIINGNDAGVISPTWANIQDPYTCSGTSGNFLVVNGENGGAVPPNKVIWEQTIAVNDWKGFKFCMKAKNLDQCGFNVTPKLDIIFSMSQIGDITETINLTAVGPCDWHDIEKTFNLWGYGTSLNIKIVLDQTQLGDGNDVAIDDIALIELPQCPLSSADFNIQTSNHPTQTGMKSITATAIITQPCNSVWWEVCEYDVSAGNCVAGTAMTSGPPVGWWNPVNNFTSYVGTSTASGSDPGVFDPNKFYKITRGSWGECDSWNDSSLIISPNPGRSEMRVFTEEEFEKNKEVILRKIKNANRRN